MKNIEKKVTLKDVAEATGLSSNTVSRVLKKKPYYTKEVETKVNEAARRLGYVGDSVATALRLGMTNTIAIVYDDFTNPFYTIMTNITAKKLRSSGYEAMIFSNYGESPFLNYDLLRRMLSRNVDGIISFLEPEPNVVNIIKKSRTKFIIVGRDGKKYGLDSTSIDNEQGGRVAGQHLVDLGYTEIAYIGANRDLEIDNLRFSGFKKALEENNISFDDKNRLYLKDFGHFHYLYDYFIHNIKAKAIFCFNDLYALQMMEKMTDDGYKFPTDYAVVGYDNIQKSLGMPKILTTVGMDTVQLAETSVEVLLQKIKEKEKNDTVFNKVLEVKLFKGPTT